MYKEFKKRLKSGENLVGTIVTLNNREKVENITKEPARYILLFLKK